MRKHTLRTKLKGRFNEITSAALACDTYNDRRRNWTTTDWPSVARRAGRFPAPPSKSRKGDQMPTDVSQEQNYPPPISETPNCPICGNLSVMLPQTWRQCTEWRCSACGHQWNDGKGAAFEAVIAEQRQLTVAAGEKAVQLAIASGLDEGQASELLAALAAIGTALRGQWSPVWIETCNAAHHAIHNAAADDKPRAFNHWLDDWIDELLEVQRQVFDHLQPLAIKYEIASSEQWLSEAFEIIWSPLRPGYRAWIMAVLEESPAPEWLWITRGHPQSIEDICARIEMRLIRDPKNGRTQMLSEAVLAITKERARAGGSSVAQPQESAPALRGAAVATNVPPEVPTPGRIIFTKRKGRTFAEKPFSKAALLNTYEALSRTLVQVRAMVIAQKGSVSIEELKNTFGRKELGRAADDENWKTWIEIFAGKSPATAKGAALVFLENKTTQPRGSLKTLLTRARKEKR